MSGAARTRSATDGEVVVAKSPSSWWLALGGAAAMAIVQPPCDLWWGAWVAPLPWLCLARRGASLRSRDWWALWCGGWFSWLAVLHWLRLPHPATSIGWLVLSAYLGCFVPFWVAATRRLVSHGRLPFALAATVAWLGSEHLRGWLLGGFTMGGLCDTQVHWLAVLQTADVFGAVGLSGLVMAVAACVTESLAAVAASQGARSWGRAAGFLTGAATVLALAVSYGHWRLSGEPRAERQLNVLLVQGSIDTELKQDPGGAQRVARHYDELTIDGLRSGNPPDLIVWPETMWRWGLLEIDPREQLPEAVVWQALGERPGERFDADSDEVQAAARKRLEEERYEPLAAYARRYAATWLVGLDKQVVTPAAATGVRNYNCGLFLDPKGTPLGCYEKMFPVMFGEYVPLADRFPWLYRLTPLPAGLTAGTTPLAVEVAGFEVAATICYETTLPRAMRTLVRQLSRQRKRPDVIANLTNDGWFWGSSELDMHLAAAVLRAVEVRTPIVVAANTGISAWVDGSGRVRRRGPKRAPATVRAEVSPDGRWSVFLFWGSWPTAAISAIAVFAVAAGFGWSRNSVEKAGFLRGGADMGEVAGSR
jgi:apolipoprotein N-acyltransferase